MVKRLLECNSNDFLQMDAKQLLQAIKSSEGRTIIAEVNIGTASDVRGVSNAEIAKAYGADLILLNKVDLQKPIFYGLDDPTSMKELKIKVGGPIGVNLEPIDNNLKTSYEPNEISIGRQAIKENFIICEEEKYDFVLLTGNPGSSVSNDAILKSIKELREYYSGIIIAGKMHHAGISESYFDFDMLEKFIESGANIILLPSVGTVPGVTIENLYKAVNFVQEKGCLALVAIGTGQESSPRGTIEQIALWNKMVGADIHHIGASGGQGMCPPENIHAFSLAIRGKRHTQFRMVHSK